MNGILLLKHQPVLLAGGFMLDKKFIYAKFLIYLGILCQLKNLFTQIFHLFFSSDRNQYFYVKLLSNGEHIEML